MLANLGVVSPVEAHLAATYRKLDVGSRRELAERLDAAGPVEALP